MEDELPEPQGDKYIKGDPRFTCRNGHSILPRESRCPVCLSSRISEEVESSAGQVDGSPTPTSDPRIRQVPIWPNWNRLVTTPKRVAKPRITLGPLQVLDGAGWAPRIGSRVALTLWEDRLDIFSETVESTLLSSVALNTLQDLRIEGQSVTSGGGFFGGGFGAKAAIEGMAIATVLNSVTRKTRKWVTIDLVAEGGWAQFRLVGAETLAVRDQLRLLGDEIVAQRQRRTNILEAPSAETDLVSSLERLTKLRDTGALSEDQFELAKERLLSSD